MTLRRLKAVAGFLAALPMMLVALPLSAQAGEPATYDEIDRFVRTEAEASGLPGVSYAIVRDGEVVHLAAFGAADSTGRPMTVDTPVIIGSVGKTLTALAVRQLIEAGQVEEDAPVQRYLPWFTLVTRDAATQITIHDLLVHESGLSRADGQRPSIYQPGLTAEDVVRGLSSASVNRQVGTYEYSNLNYIILGVVVEAASGRSYDEYMREHIFAPLGMEHSFATRAPAVTDGLAQGHRYLFGLPVGWQEPYPTAIVPAGYQISTASDMARYVAAFSDHGRYHGVDIVGETDGTRNYGIDWSPVSGVPWGYTPGHSGATLTENTGLIYMPIAHLGVVVLTNANPTQLWLASPRGASEIAFDVLRRTLGEAPLTGGPTVRVAYLAVDAVLIALVGILLVEALRLRGWRRRIAGARLSMRLLAPSLLIDVALPLVILVLFPLWIGTTGTTPANDVLGTWAVAFWVLPDVAVSLVTVSVGLLIVAAIKAWQLRLHRVEARVAPSQSASPLGGAGMPRPVR